MNDTVLNLVALTLGVAIVFPRDAAAEFFTWNDADGIRHVSTHPQSCFRDGHVNTLLPGCQAWHLTPAQIRRNESERAQQQRNEQAAAFAEECKALREKTEQASKALRDMQASMPSRVLQMDVGELIDAPFKAAALQGKMLASHKEYDKCVPVSEREGRKRARDDIRRRTAENVRHEQQQGALRGIEGKLNEIERRLGR